MMNQSHWNEGPRAQGASRALLALACFLCCFFIVGCAATQGAAPPASAWRRVRTDHIELITDLSEAGTLRAATALERTRAALLQAAWSKLSTTRKTERLRVIVLSSALEFERYFGRDLDGFHTNLGGETVVLWGTPEHWERRLRLTDASTTSVLRHEMVHHLAAGIYGRQPRWFAEGLAQFLETLVISEDGTTATLGRAHLPALHAYKAVRSLSVKDALVWSKPLVDENAIEVAGLYGLSWLMVHWMFNTQPAAFTAFQGAIARGEDPDEAWARSFEGRSLDEMDAALYKYARFGEPQIYTVPLQPVEIHPVSIAISAADVHALRAQLAMIRAGMEKVRNVSFDAEAQREILEALEIEPGNVAALKLVPENRMPKTELIERLREQTRRRPDDGEAWLFLGESLEGGANASEQEAAIRKGVALLPGDSRAYNDLAWYLVRTGRGAEALPLATKAALLAPWNSAVLDTYAASLFAVDRCPDALRVQLRAVENLPERLRGTASTRHYDEALRRYRSACGAHSSP